jgi:hypothetical protein
MQTLQYFQNSRLHIVHITTEDEEVHAQPPLVQQLQALTPIYQALAYNNISEGLQTYAQQIAADLLIALPHQHSLLEGWLLSPIGSLLLLYFLVWSTYLTPTTSGRRTPDVDLEPEPHWPTSSGRRSEDDHVTVRS